MKKTVLSFGILSSIISFSQEHESDSLKHVKSIDEVQISSTRIPEIKTNAAATVTIITEKQIQELTKVSADMSQILGMIVPGIALSSNTTSNRSQSLRGRSMLVLIDGIPQSTPLRSTDRDIRTIDPAAIERIEIIKGATSLYGNGAIGGIMNVITKKEKDNRPFGGQTNLSITDRNFFENKRGFGYRFNQQFHGKIKKFDYLTNVTINQTGSAIDGEKKYISPRYGLGDTRTINVLAKIGYDFNENNRIDAMYNYYTSTQDTPLIASGGVYLDSPRIGIIGDKDPQAENEGTKYNHNAYIKYHSKNIFYNTNFELSLYTQSLYTIFDFRKHNPKSPRWESTSGQATIKAEKFGARAQFVTKLNLSERISTNILYGFDYLNDVTSQPLTDGRMWIPEMTSNSAAPFIQTKTTFYDNFNLKVGLRYDNISVHVPDYNVIPLKAGDPTINVSGGNLKYNNAAFNTGLAYDKYKPFQPFIAFSQGFSIYDLGRTLRAAKADILHKIETDPVKTNNYEIGAYSEIGNFLTLNAAFFHTFSKLGSDLVSENGFWVVDRSPQKISGFEISADAKITKKIGAGGNFTTLEGKKKSTSGDWDSYMSGLSIPASKTTLYASYKPSTNSYINLYYIHTGKRDRFQTNAKGAYEEGEGRVNSIDLFNLSAGFTHKNVTYSLGVENLFDKAYYTPSSMLIARNAEYARGNGRYVTLSLGYKF
ncbi:TonB-dependent receptor [Chryseobacterium sp. T1]